MYIARSNVVFRDSQFQACTTTLQGTAKGGAIFADSSTVTLDGVHIHNCKSTRGGGMFTQGGTLTIRRSNWTNLTATAHGGGLYTFGGTTVNMQDTRVSDVIDVSS